MGERRRFTLAGCWASAAPPKRLDQKLLVQLTTTSGIVWLSRIFWHILTGAAQEIPSSPQQWLTGTQSKSELGSLLSLKHTGSRGELVLQGREEVPLQALESQSIELNPGSATLRPCDNRKVSNALWVSVAPPYMQCEENKYIKENALLLKKISGRRRLARRQGDRKVYLLSACPVLFYTKLNSF